MAGNKANPIISKEDARTMLGQYVQPGDTIYCVLRHRSPSTFLTVLEPFIIREGRLRCIRGAVAALLGYKLDLKHGGIDSIYSGANPAQDLACDLSHALFGDLAKLDGETL